MKLRALVLILASGWALHSSWSKDVDELSCESCRSSRDSSSQSCYACHLCTAESIEVVWPKNLPSKAQSLALAETKSALLAVELILDRPLSRLAGPTLGGLPSTMTGEPHRIALEAATLTAAELKSGGSRRLQLHYGEKRLADLQIPVERFLAEAKIRAVICEDTDGSGACVEENRSLQVLPASREVSLCRAPEFLVIQP